MIAGPTPACCFGRIVIAPILYCLPSPKLTRMKPHLGLIAAVAHLIWNLRAFNHPIPSGSTLRTASELARPRQYTRLHQLLRERGEVGFGKGLRGDGPDGTDVAAIGIVLSHCHSKCSLLIRVQPARMRSL